MRGNLRAPRDQVLETVVNGVKQTFGDKYQVFLVPDPDSEEADPKGGPRWVAYAKLIAVTIIICLQSGQYKTALERVFTAATGIKA